MGRGCRTVPAVGVFGHNLEPLALGHGPDRNGRVGLLNGFGITVGLGDGVVFARIRGSVFGKHFLHDDDAFSHLVRSDAAGRKRVAVGLILLIHPAGPQTDFHPAFADVVQAGRHLSQKGGVAIGIAQHQPADAERGGDHGHGRHDRPALQEIGLGHPARPHVIGKPDGVETGLLAGQGPFSEQWKRQADLGLKQTKLNGTGHGVLLSFVRTCG